MATREYELMYIVRPTVPEDQLTATTNQVDGMVSTLGGEVVDNQPWGKRRLAYSIEKHEDGYYVVARLNMDPTRTHELEEQLRISDDVIRHMLTIAVEPVRPRPLVPPQDETAASPASQSTAPAGAADEEEGEVGDIETEEVEAEDTGIESEAEEEDADQG